MKTSEIDVQSLVDQATDAAKKAGIAGEAYALSSRSFQVEVTDGEIEALQEASERGIGIRAFEDGKVGFAYTTDLSSQGISQVVQQARENARATVSDEYNRLPGPASFQPLDLMDPAIETVSVDEKIERAREVEAAARAYDKRIKRVRKAAYSDGLYHVGLANTNGVRASYQGTFFSTDIMAAAEGEDGSEVGWSHDQSRYYKDLKTKEVGEEAAVRAVSMLGGKTVQSQRVPVLFDPFVVGEFLQVLAPGLTADAVQKGKSLFRDKLGKTIGSSLVRLVDDGLLPNGAATAPVDDEGVPMQKTVLVEGGQLKVFLQNTYTAARDGVKSTGNGVRNSFRGTPEVRPTNFYLEKGSVSRDQLMKDIKDGFYITSAMGMHTANPITGEFSVGAVGLWIKDGQFASPVRGVTIAGNLLEILEGVDGVADDLRFLGGYGAPTIRIQGLTVGGE